MAVPYWGCLNFTNLKSPQLVESPEDGRGPASGWVGYTGTLPEQILSLSTTMHSLQHSYSHKSSYLVTSLAVAVNSDS